VRHMFIAADGSLDYELLEKEMWVCVHAGGFSWSKRTNPFHVS
jgi:hypothetical protein